MPPKASTSSSGLPLSEFLKLLTSAKTLTMSQAMAAAGKLLPLGFNTLDRLSTLSAPDLTEMGFDENARKALLLLTGRVKGKGKAGESSGSGAKGSGKKRKFGSDLDRPLPTREVKDVIVETDLDFEEIWDEEALRLKRVVVNRAPVMSGWGVVVCERLGELPPPSPYLRLGVSRADWELCG